MDGIVDGEFLPFHPDDCLSLPICQHRSGQEGPLAKGHHWGIVSHNLSTGISGICVHSLPSILHYMCCCHAMRRKQQTMPQDRMATLAKSYAVLDAFEWQHFLIVFDCIVQQTNLVTQSEGFFFSQKERERERKRTWSGRAKQFINGEVQDPSLGTMG